MGRKETPKTVKFDVEAMKLDIRGKLKELDEKQVDAVAKKFGIDLNIPSLKKAANPGMRRMNLSNMIVGSAARAAREDGRGKNEILALVK